MPLSIEKFSKIASSQAPGVSECLSPPVERTWGKGPVGGKWAESSPFADAEKCSKLRLASGPGRSKDLYGRCGQRPAASIF